MAILQFPDDTVLCISHDPDKAINLKLLLYSFELMTGLKINYMKSEVFLVGGDNDIATLYSNMFGCQVGKLPLKYLGVPVVGYFGDLGCFPRSDILDCYSRAALL